MHCMNILLRKTLKERDSNDQRGLWCNFSFILGDDRLSTLAWHSFTPFINYGHDDNRNTILVVTTIILLLKLKIILPLFVDRSEDHDVVSIAGKNS